MKKKIFITLLIVFPIAIYGQTGHEELIKKFFDEYSRDPGKSIDDLYATNPWSIRIKDGIENVKKEINSYTEDYVGKFYGYELITKKQFSESFIIYSYLIKYDRQPMRFNFMLYKPNDKWTLYSFKVDSGLAAEIEEATKLYYLNLNTDK